MSKYEYRREASTYPASMFITYWHEETFDANCVDGWELLSHSEAPCPWNEDLIMAVTIYRRPKDDGSSV
jgi:hypothetical protein